MTTNSGTTSPIKVWRNQKKITKMLGRRGKIISWTVIRVPPTGFSYQAPYPVVLVKLSSGRNIVAQLVDSSEQELCIGQRVVTVVRRTSKAGSGDVIPYGIKVKPLAS